MKLTVRFQPLLCTNLVCRRSLAKINLLHRSSDGLKKSTLVLFNQVRKLPKVCDAKCKFPRLLTIFDTGGLDMQIGYIVNSGGTGTQNPGFGYPKYHREMG